MWLFKFNVISVILILIFQSMVGGDTDHGDKPKKLLIKATEIHRHQLTHPRFLHRNTIDHIYRTHRLFVVRNNDEL